MFNVPTTFRKASMWKQGKSFLKVTQYGKWKLHCFETKMDSQACNVSSVVIISKQMVYLSEANNKQLIKTQSYSVLDYFFKSNQKSTKIS